MDKLVCSRTNLREHFDFNICTYIRYSCKRRLNFAKRIFVNSFGESLFCCGFNCNYFFYCCYWHCIFERFDFSFKCVSNFFFYCYFSAFSPGIRSQLTMSVPCQTMVSPDRKHYLPPLAPSPLNQSPSLYQNVKYATNQ